MSPLSGYSSVHETESSANNESMGSEYKPDKPDITIALFDVVNEYGIYILLITF